MTVPRGSFVLLRPEDVGDRLDGVLYAWVVSIGRKGVNVKPLAGARAKTVIVSPLVAEQRLVSEEEATSRQIGRWLRKAVSYTSRALTGYGQVINYEGDVVMIATFDGMKRVMQKNLVGEVYPVVAVAMGFKQWPRRMWRTQRLVGLQDTLLSATLAGAGGSHLTTTALQSRVDGIKGITDRQVEWIESNTGATRSASLSSVLKHVFYTEGSRAGSSNPQVRLRSNFCCEPEEVTSPLLTGAARSEDDSLFDPVLDDHDVPDPVVGVQPNAFGARDPPMTVQNISGPSVRDEVELLERIRQHKPHLLAFYPTSLNSAITVNTLAAVSTRPRTVA